jgi:hypothetical protein
MQAQEATPLNITHSTYLYEAALEMQVSVVLDTAWDMSLTHTGGDQLQEDVLLETGLFINILALNFMPIMRVLISRDIPTEKYTEITSSHCRHRLVC